MEKRWAKRLLFVTLQALLAWNAMQSDCTNFSLRGIEDLTQSPVEIRAKWTKNRGQGDIIRPWSHSGECMFYDIVMFITHTHQKQRTLLETFSFRFPNFHYDIVMSDSWEIPFWNPLTWSSNFGLSVPFTSSPAPKPPKSVASAHRSRVCVETKGDRTWWGQWPKMNKAKLSIDHGFRVPHVSRYIFV
jgi:hypothetical protein